MDQILEGQNSLTTIDEASKLQDTTNTKMAMDELTLLGNSSLQQDSKDLDRPCGLPDQDMKDAMEIAEELEILNDDDSKLPGVEVQNLDEENKHEVSIDMSKLPML